MRIKGLHVVRSGGVLAAPVARAEGDGEAAASSNQMELRFAPFNNLYEINSYFEGRFLEQVAPGTFKRTIDHLKRADGNYGMKSLFNHGMDFNIGDKLLGTVSSLSEEQDSPVALVDLYEEASYVRDLMPGLRAGDYGSSFMFEVLNDSWQHEPGTSDANPEGLPIRTITEVRLLEAGPVTFPANPAATAGMRSGCHTDRFLERMSQFDADRHRDTIKMFDAFRSGNGLSTAPAPEAPDLPAPARHVEDEAAKRAARLRELRLSTLTGGVQK